MQLGLALAGGAAGGLLGGGTGAGIGFLAGSLLGAFLTKKTNYGSKIEDSKLLTSSYGNVCPIGYGTIRIAGTIIWEGTRREIKSSTSSKGISSKNVSYSYKQSFAVMFADRPSESIVKLYIDSELVFDKETAGSAPSSSQQECTIKGLFFQYYNGSETQEPDSVMEAEEGVGEVPAYRGCSYIVFNDADLTPWGGRKPVNIEAVLTFNSTDYFPYYDIPNTDGYSIKAGYMWKDPNRPYVFAMAEKSGHAYLLRINLETRLIEQASSVDGLYFADQSGAEAYSLGVALGTSWVSATQVWGYGSGLNSACIDPEGYFWRMQPNTTNYSPIWRINPYNCDFAFPAQAGQYSSPFGGWNKPMAFEHISFHTFPEVGKIILAAGNFDGGCYVFSREYVALNNSFRYMCFCSDQLWLSPYAATGKAIEDKNGEIWVPCGKGRNVGGSSFSYAKILHFSYMVIPNPDILLYPGTTHIVMWNRLEELDISAYMYSLTFFMYDKDAHVLLCYGHRYYANTQGALVRYDLSTKTVTHEFDFTQLPVNSRYFGSEINFASTGINNGEIVLSGGGTSNGYVAKIRVSDLSLIKVYTNSSMGFSGADWFSFGSNCIYDPITNSVLSTRGYNSSLVPSILYLDRSSAGGETLKAIVDDITFRNGIGATDIVSTDLSSVIVSGFKIGSQTSGLSCLQQLAEVFLFTGVESDWKLNFERFVSKTSKFTIIQKELGVGEGTGLESPLTEVLANESEIPFRVIVIYMDSDREYQNGSQQDSRSMEATVSRKIQEFSYPIVLSADYARQLSQIRLYQYWLESKVYKLSTFLKHMRIDPADIGSITYGSNTFTVYVKSTDIGSNLTIELECSAFDSTVFTSLISGDYGQYTDQALKTYGQCDVLIFDLPYLRDTDFDSDIRPILYFGIKAYNSNWNGGTVYKSIDQFNWDPLFSMENQLVWGYALEALPVTAKWETWDRYNSLRVKIVNGTLASVDEFNCLTNGENAILLRSGSNWEILCFATATSEGSGVYVLSDLLRGLQGTNLFNDHKSGDLLFVLNRNFMTKYVCSSSDISSERYFRSTSFNSQIDGVTNPISMDANCLKPWTPCSVEGSRDGSNNLTITWKRRTRAGGDWRNGGRVPLNETTESYFIDIIDPADEETVIRTISATSETATYTAAEQTTDGLTPGDDVYIDIGQINAVVGRGFTLREVV